MKKQLHIIPSPDPSTRSIIRGSGGAVPSFFVGTGNVDYSCGSCGTILAKSVWEPSISNVVVQCPSCDSYNDFPRLADSDWAKVQLSQGHFNYSGHVKLDVGKSIEGA